MTTVAPYFGLARALWIPAVYAWDTYRSGGRGLVVPRPAYGAC